MIEICRHCQKVVPDDMWHCPCTAAKQEWDEGILELRINGWELDALRMFITVDRNGKETVWNDTERLSIYLNGPFSEIVKFLRPGQQIVIKAVERKAVKND